MDCKGTPTYGSLVRAYEENISPIRKSGVLVERYSRRVFHCLTKHDPPDLYFVNLNRVLLFRRLKGCSPWGEVVRLRRNDLLLRALRNSDHHPLGVDRT